MDTGENQQALRGVIDFLRKCSVILLALHCYVYCHTVFASFGWSLQLTDRIIKLIGNTGVFDHIAISKSISLGLLLVSLIGAKGKKDGGISTSSVMMQILFGLSLFWGSLLIFYAPWCDRETAAFYVASTVGGYLLLLSGGSKISRLLKIRLQRDIFNEKNETFPQCEELVENEHSLNFPAVYRWKGKTRRMFCNLPNPYRSTLLCSGPGGGKTRYVVVPALEQMIRKGFTLFVYDFKFDDLTVITYNLLQKYKHLFAKPPSFYVINFDDLSRTHRCNPLDPQLMDDITDAAEASRSVLIGLNREFAKKNGDFFVESSINFVTACIWYLKLYENGKFCTLPHVIELMSLPYDELFPILGTVPELENLVNPFLSAYLNRANEQLEGQIASAKIGMARLVSPQLYYVLSGNDFTLDINNPDDPKILCCGNNSLKIQIYGAVISLYMNRMLKVINRKGQKKCGLVLDEYSTIYCPMDHVVASGRSNLLAPLIVVQSYEQLRRDYSKEQAEALITMCGNIICGQGAGDTAKMVSELIGKIVQVRESVSTNRSDTNTSTSTQLDYAVPPSRIALLSPGEFVGKIADNPDQKIKHKAIHCQFDVNEELEQAVKRFKPLPVIRNLAPKAEMNTFNRIKNEIDELAETEIQRIKNTPELSYLIIRRPGPSQPKNDAA